MKPSKSRDPRVDPLDGDELDLNGTLYKPDAPDPHFWVVFMKYPPVKNDPGVADSCSLGAWRALMKDARVLAKGE